MSRRRASSNLLARLGRDEGFGLLELVIVIALMGVVTTVGISSFTDLTVAWHDTQTLAQMHVAAGDALEIVREDFERLPSSTLTGGKIVGKHETREGVDRIYHQMAMANDQVVLPTPGLSGNIKIQYALDHSDRHTLVRIVHPAAGSAEPTREKIAERFDIVRLRIEYQERGNPEWLRSWDRADYPASVRVSLTLVDQSDPTVQVARKTTIPIRVQ